MTRHKLKPARNGWVLESGSGADLTRIVGQERDHEDAFDSFIDFLYSIKEIHGPSEGKYSQKRIRILGLPGSDYMGELTKEQIEMMQDIIHECIGHLERRHIEVKRHYDD
jgi:hypothetical protein